MKIRLKYALPLESKHGAIAGAEFEVIRIHNNTHFVTGPHGQFGALPHEFDVIDAGDAPEPTKDAPPPPAPPVVLTTYTDPQKLEKATAAVEHILNIIRDNPKVRYHLGYGSQSWALLSAAYAAIEGVSEDAVEETFLRG